MIYKNIMTQGTDHKQGMQLEKKLELYASDIKQRTNDLERSKGMLLALQSTNQVFTNSFTLETALTTVIKEITHFLHVSGCAFSLWNQKEDTICTLTDYGPEEWFLTTEASIFHLNDYPLTKKVLVDKYVAQLTINQPDIDPAEWAYMHKEEIKTNVMLPMIYQDRVIGLVEIFDEHFERSFTEEEISLAQSLVNQAAVAIENERLTSETERQLKEQTALRETAEILSSTLDFNEVLTRIAEQVALVTDTTSAYISIYESDTRESTVLAEYISPQACEEERISDLGVTYHRDLSDFVELMEAGQVDINHIDDSNLAAEDREHMLEYGAKTVLYIPLRYQGRFNGYVELWESRRKREYTTEEIKLLHSIAQQAANAIENAHLYQQAQQEIKHRKRLQAQLERYADDLQRSNQDLQQFAYIASHDLQEPLRMITSYLQLLERRYKGSLDSDADEFIHFAVNGALRMQELINALLLYSRIETRGFELQLTDCNEAVNQVLDNLKLAIEESNAQIHYDGLPVVMGDSTQLTQLFQNLIGNAIKYHRTGPPRIQLKAKRQDGEWLFSIQDNGIGFSQEQADRIFMIFQRLHNREKYPGTGIGLAICKRIIERHNGRIWAKSQQGEGSTFYFTIPISEEILI